MTKRRSSRRKNEDLGICPTPDRLWKSTCGTDLPSILERDEAFSAAHTIHGGNPLIRSELQARILANQPQREIAARMGLPIDVVANYEDWWFDVRDRFEATSWIAHEAIQRRPTGELLAGDIGPFWRWLGFHFGPSVLESFLTAASPESLCSNGLDAYWQKSSTLDADLKLLIMAQRMPVPRTEKQLLRLSRFHAVLWDVKDVRTDDLLRPVTLEMSPFGEPEFHLSPIESQDPTEELEDPTTIFDVKSRPVVQTLVA